MGLDLRETETETETQREREREREREGGFKFGLCLNQVR